MEYEEIERVAAKGAPLAKHPDLEALYCYTLLRILYHDFYEKSIDLETARQKKQEIRQAFEDAERLHARYAAVYARYQDNIRTGEKYNYEIKNAIWSHAGPLEVTRLCLKLYGALTGDDTVANAYLKKLEETNNV